MLQTIGMIGGVSAESTALYYRGLNEEVRKGLGGLNSARLILSSLNYAPIVAWEREGRWDFVAEELVSAARELERAGAGCVILCCNTLHKVALEIEEALTIPFLHIADAAGSVMVKNGVRRVALLGTQVTMEETFYSSRLREKFGIDVITPPQEERLKLDRIIYEELCQGKVEFDSKTAIASIIEELATKGAEAALLACTELGMLVEESDVSIPLYDTMALHVEAAANWSLGRGVSIR